MLRKCGVNMLKNEEAVVVLLRHGESAWTAENKFTGWVDVPLTPTGAKQAWACANQLLKEGLLSFDEAHSSALQRTICTMDIVFQNLNSSESVRVGESFTNNQDEAMVHGMEYSDEATQCSQEVDTVTPMPTDGYEAHPRATCSPGEISSTNKYLENVATEGGAVNGGGTHTTSTVVRHDWRLNERHYGELTGMNKAEVGQKFGLTQLKVWRRSLRVPPPAMNPHHPFFRQIVHDQRYLGLGGVDGLTRGESLQQVMERVGQFWQEHVAGSIQQRKRVLIVAHSNVIRSLVTLIEALDEEEVTNLNIPNCVPIVYRFDPTTCSVIGKRKYLGDEHEVEQAIINVEKQGEIQHTV